jgi:hypothetical protein
MRQTEFATAEMRCFGNELFANGIDNMMWLKNQMSLKPNYICRSGADNRCRTETS